MQSDSLYVKMSKHIFITFNSVGIATVRISLSNVFTCSTTIQSMFRKLVLLLLFHFIPQCIVSECRSIHSKRNGHPATQARREATRVRMAAFRRYILGGVILCISKCASPQKDLRQYNLCVCARANKASEHLSDISSIMRCKIFLTR